MDSSDDGSALERVSSADRVPRGRLAYCATSERTFSSFETVRAESAFSSAKQSVPMFAGRELNRSLLRRLACRHAMDSEGFGFSIRRSVRRLGPIHPCRVSWFGTSGTAEGGRNTT